VSECECKREVCCNNMLSSYISQGGNSGIGLENCKVLAHAGARVILCSRSVASGEKAIESEIKQMGQGHYTVHDTSNVSIWYMYDIRLDYTFTVLYCTVLYCTILYYTILYYTILYCTVLYCTVMY
jgi:hypothetical protein